MKRTRIKSITIIQELSQPRLSTYRKASQTDADALLAYKKNILLSMAIYPILQQFEVVFRNKLEQVLISDYGLQWYTSPKFVGLLDAWGNQKLKEILKKIHKSNITLHSGAVISEGMLGFWTSLLGVHYNSAIWFRHDRDIFPFATTSQRNIGKIRVDLETIRKLRNRISHHESIYRDANLLAKYQTIMALLDWMNPQVGLWLKQTRLDNFMTVYNSVYHPKTKKKK